MSLLKIPTSISLPSSPVSTFNNTSNTNTNTTNNSNNDYKSINIDLINTQLSNISRWITCLCIVNFDLLIGQTVEYSIPEFFNEVELQNIANSAFPDSNSGKFNDTVFTFRFRSNNNNNNNSTVASPKNNRYPYYFGYSFFRQLKDSTIKRGYFQKSVVLISHLPINFEPLISYIGAMYFDCGVTALESALHAIASWPNPIPSIRVLELPCLGQLFQMHIDPLSIGSIDESVNVSLAGNYSFVSANIKRDCQSGGSSLDNSPSFSPMNQSSKLTQQSSATIFQQNRSLALSGSLPRFNEPKISAPSNALLKLNNSNNSLKTKKIPDDSESLNEILSRVHASAPGMFQHINLFQTFHNILPSLWYIWELSLTSSTVLFIAKTPAVCSHIVLGMVSIISPIIFRGDYRPYFTLYDPDFRHFQLSAHTSVVIGTTNPFFFRAFESFPNIVHVPTEHNAAYDSSFSANIKVRNETDNPEDIPAGHIYVKNQPLIGVNKTVLNQLMNPLSLNNSDEDANSFASINNSILRRHFYELTNQFLAPFQKYFNPVNPNLANNEIFNPFLHPPILPIFNEKSFLEEIESSSSSKFVLLYDSGLELRTLVELYSRFFRSPHFYPWFNRSLDEARYNLEKRIETLIRFVDMKALMNAMPIRQALLVLDSVQSHLQKVTCRKAKSTFDKDLLNALIDYRAIILKCLPDSIRDGVAASNPLPNDPQKPSRKVSKAFVLSEAIDDGRSLRAVSKSNEESISPLLPPGVDSFKNFTSPSKLPLAVVDNFF